MTGRGGLAPIAAVPAASTTESIPAPREGLSLPLLHLYGVWIITITEFHFFLGNVIAGPLAKVVNLAFPPLLLMMLIQGPVIIANAKTWVWFPQLLLLVLAAASMIPFAVNPLWARQSAQYLLIYYILSVATVLYIRTPSQAELIVRLLWWQFVLWGVSAIVGGRVWWHPTVSNDDAFGGLMVQGVGYCLWFGVAAQSKRTKYLLMALAVYCVAGVVQSYARGAFLSLVALAGWMWLRSPRKALAAGIGAVGVVVVVLAAMIFFDASFFYNEMMSSFEEGAEEGTGGARWELWKAGYAVWKSHPFVGVGGGNFGAFAAGFFREGDIPLFPNPSMLYGMNLHNAFVEILSEFGIVGSAAFVWILIDFQRRNNALRKPEAVALWAAKTGGKYNLRYISLGLEAANVANLLAGVFYASLFMPWFFATWAANRMIWGVTRPTSESGSSPEHSRTSAHHSLRG